MKSKSYLNILIAIVTIVLVFIWSGVVSNQSVNFNPPKIASHFSGQTEVTQPEIVPGIVVVKIRSAAIAQSLAKAATATGLASLDVKLQQFGATSVQKMFRHKPIPAHSAIPDISRFLKISIPEQMNPVMVAQELAGDPNVEYAEPVYVRYLMATPNDPRYGEQWHLPQIKAPQAWDVQKKQQNSHYRHCGYRCRL